MQEVTNSGNYTGKRNDTALFVLLWYRVGKTGKKIKRLCKNETSCSGGSRIFRSGISMQDLAGYVETSASYILEKGKYQFLSEIHPVRQFLQEKSR